MGFKDRTAAMKMRDIITAIVQREVNKLRPLPAYGTVQSINRAARTCSVLIPPDVSPVTVGMGSVQPSTTGQYVRIEGVPGDRYIASVMGAAFYA